MKQRARELLAVGILSGDIIGAGIFSLPYAFQKSGILTGAAYLALFGGVFAITHLMYADIIMRTKEGGRFASFAHEFVGSFAYYPALFITSVGALLVLSIYLALSLSFGRVLIGSVSGFWLVGLFWLIGSLGILFNIKELAFSETFLTGCMFTIIVIVGALGLSSFLGDSLSVSLFNLSFDGLFLPFGATLFALMGRSAIPSVVKLAKLERLSKASVTRIVVFGTCLPACLYLLFALGILGLSGTVSEDAISGIAGAHPGAALAAVLLGIIAILTTYVVLGVSTVEILWLDVGMPRGFAKSAVITLPLMIFLLGSQSFFTLVSLVGGIFVAGEAMFIILIWQGLNKERMPRLLIKGKASLIVFVPLAILCLGFLYELQHIFS